jgi:hypothetical protein
MLLTRGFEAANKKTDERSAKQKAPLFSDEELVAFCGINCKDCKARSERRLQLEVVQRVAARVAVRLFQGDSATFQECGPSRGVPRISPLTRRHANLLHLNKGTMREPYLRNSDMRQK